MPTVEAQVPTDRASRYLTQLCRHLGQMSRMRHQPSTHQDGQAPPAVQHVDWTDTSGTIRFPQGTCTLSATADTLTVRIDADDEDALRRLQDGIGRRLDTIGRRDQLTVHWQQSNSDTDGPRDLAGPAMSSNTATARRGRRFGGVAALVMVAAVAVLVHLGVLGAALAASAWAGWGANLVLILIGVKIITVALHGVLGRMAFRHRGILRRWRRGHADDEPEHSHEHAA